MVGEGAVVVRRHRPIAVPAGWHRWDTSRHSVDHTMTTPILKTNRLNLRPPIFHDHMDVGHYLKWFSNGHVLQYSEHRHREHTDQSQRDYIRMFNNGAINGMDFHFWEILRTGVCIGSITAHRNIPNKSANVGIMIGDVRVWGEGYGSEAFDTVCKYLFGECIRKVEAGCMASNGGMASVLKKCGFELEAVLPNYFLLEGKPEDMHYYGKYHKAKIIPIQSGGK